MGVLLKLRLMFVYILYSSSLDRFYIGFTTDLPEQRLERHLAKYYENAFTRKADDWELFWWLQCKSEAQAKKIERHIKRMKSRVFIQTLKKYSDIGIRLLEQYAIDCSVK